jgi:hypothetical protein
LNLEKFCGIIIFVRTGGKLPVVLKTERSGLRKSKNLKAGVRRQLKMDVTKMLADLRQERSKLKAILTSGG